MPRVTASPTAIDDDREGTFRRLQDTPRSRTADYDQTSPYELRQEKLQTQTIIREERRSVSDETKRPPIITRSVSVHRSQDTSSHYRDAQTRWILDSKARTEEFRRSGATSSTTWVFVDGGKVPVNAVQGGEENGIAWYVARAFYEGTVYLAKAGPAYPYGAVIDSLGGNIAVEQYEVLVHAVPSIKWFDASTVVGNESRIESQMVERERMLTLEALFARISKLDAIRETLRTETKVYTIEEEKEYKALRQYDTIVVVDDSSSMRQLWLQTRHALAGIAEKAAKYDADGIDICFLNNELKGLGLKNPSSVMRLFADVNPAGATYLGQKLESLINDFLTALETSPNEMKPLNIIVITDGKPTDDLEGVLLGTVRRLRNPIYNRFSGPALGIELVQIGDDRNPTRDFAVLNNNYDLEGVPGILDTVRISNGSQLTTGVLTTILLGGIDRRHDRYRI